MTLPFNNKKNQLKFINCVVGCHDLLCECYNPLFHSAKIILKQLEPEITPQEKQQLQECLGTKDTTKEEDATTGIDIGDLEKLFEEDAGEDDPTTG
uniref:ORF2 n=1 Tax=Torque teno virus TaxID=68887 RepID=A0A7D6X0G1_9VIRU|nr:ORF2 [Torque teno virus]